MFFVAIGRFFFEKNRLILFFFLLATPFALVLSSLVPRYVMLKKTEQKFDEAALQGYRALEKRQEKEQFLARYSDFEPYFIDQYLETVPLLQNSCERLIAIQNHPACKNREAIQRRIHFSQGSANRLSFAEQEVRSSQKIKETREQLLRPVEIDAYDLERLLSLIEDISIGNCRPHPRSPQLLIENFHLSKKEGALYELNLSLIKREFYHVAAAKN
jgi:hypothetical protein